MTVIEEKQDEGTTMWSATAKDTSLASQSEVLSSDEDLLSTNSSEFVREVNNLNNELELKTVRLENEKQEQKRIRNIMMSSHNVSSVNEFDNNRMMLNAKIMNGKRITASR